MHEAPTTSPDGDENRAPMTDPTNAAQGSSQALPSRRALRESRALDARRAVEIGQSAAAAPRSIPTPPAARAAQPPVSTRPGASSRAAYVKRDAAPAYASPVRRKKGGGVRRVGALLAALLVPGIFIGTSLPAWAFGSDSPLAATVTSADGQSVDATGDVADATRSNFTATTAKQLAAKKRAAALAAAQTSGVSGSGGAYSVVGPRLPGDDYPFRGSYALSPLGYVESQCTDFVAWRLNRDAGVTGSPWKYVWSNMTPGGGNASEWAGAWKNNGWKTSSTPVVGSVAWFYGNHVAYVKSISGGNVSLEEYNWGGSRSYHTRTIPASQVALFLYPPPR